MDDINAYLREFFNSPFTKDGLDTVIDSIRDIPVDSYSLDKPTQWEERHLLLNKLEYLSRDIGIILTQINEG